MSKPINSTTPNYQQPQKNTALNEYIYEGKNPVHQAHVRKAEELAKPKTQFNPPKVSGGVGNPWIAMEKQKK